MQSLSDDWEYRNRSCSTVPSAVTGYYRYVSQRGVDGSGKRSPRSCCGSGGRVARLSTPSSHSSRSSRHRPFARILQLLAYLRPPSLVCLLPVSGRLFPHVGGAHKHCAPLGRDPGRYLYCRPGLASVVRQHWGHSDARGPRCLLVAVIPAALCWEGKSWALPPRGRRQLEQCQACPAMTSQQEEH